MELIIKVARRSLMKLSRFETDLTRPIRQNYGDFQA
jgi:hypothetical protein